MAKPLNEQNILERVENETRLENETPAGSAIGSNPGTRKSGTTVRAASGVANESVGYFGAGPGTA